MLDSVIVRVPATSANLGSGFDSIGLALGLTEDVTLTTAAASPDNGGVARLALDAAKAAYRRAHVDVPHDLSASSTRNIPLGRGLGGSAAARAAGIVAANALMGDALAPDAMLALGAALEGHADNVAPALFGGLRVVVRDGETYRHIAVPIAAGLRVLLFIPEFEMPTAESRKLLPELVSREDAVHNIGRAALLVAALARGEWDALDAATQDRLHQPMREQTFPAMPHIFRAAKDAGALCAYLSGGGSTIGAFGLEGEERIARAMMQEGIARGYSGQTLITEPSEAGALILGG